MTRHAATATYIYCVVAGRRAPSLRAAPKGLAGAGRARLLEVAFDRPHRRGLRCWLVAADVPLDRYDEAAIAAGLSDLDWVSRAAVAHEAMVEHFAAAPGLLPMKLFTIFASDDRAVGDFRQQGRRIERALARVLNRDEWGVRLMLTAVPPRRTPARPRAASGSSYLERKKLQRDAAVELAGRAGDVAAELYDALAGRTAAAERRAVAAAPAGRERLLLDAVFLVPRARTSSFKAAVKRRTLALKPEGYLVALTGPWPPYSFVED